MTRSRRAMKSLGVVLVLLALILTAGLAALAGPVNADDPNVSVDKTAQAVDGCRRYEVTLTITGTPPPRSIDVILVIDRSGSMGYGSYPTSLDYAKDAAKDFADKILTGHPENRVGVVSYSGSSSLYQVLTNNLGAVQSAINDLSDGGWTNIEAGFMTASNHMASAGRDPGTTARAIVLISDGVANRRVGGSGCDTWPTAHTACTIEAYEAGQNAQSQALVFTVGLLGYIHYSQYSSSEGVARDTLVQAQNGGYFETLSGADLTNIYNAIAGQVNPAATNVVVEDQIAAEFSFYGPSPLNPDKGTAFYSLGNHTITWTFATLGDESVTLTYQVTANAGSSGTLPVNDHATMIYTDADGVPQSLSFPNPAVVVPDDLSANAGTDTGFCAGGSVQLFGLPNGMVTYNWTGPENYPDTQNPTVSTAGTYTLTVTDNKGCTDTDDVVVTDYILPDCTITTPAAVIGGSTHTASVVDAGVGATYAWSVTGGTLDSGQNTNEITWTAGPSGTVHIDVTIEDANGCSNTCDVDVTITECFIDAEASNSGPVCQGEAVQLFGEPIGGTPPYEYSWSGPLGFSSTQQNPIRSPAVAGTYTLVVTDADECTGSDTTIVAVNPFPDCTITAPSLVSPGSTNTASVTPAGGTYFWSVTGEGTLVGGQNTPSITWIAGDEGTATISVTVTDANGCESTCFRTVTVRPTPTPPPPLCSPEILLAVLLDGSSTMNSTEWQIQLDGLSEAILDPDCMPNCYVELTVIQFAGEIRGDARTEIQPTVINSNNRDEVAQDVLDIVKSGGITPMEAGIDRAVNELRSSIYFRSALKRIINISSDVQENTLDRPAIEEARDNAIAAGITEISAEGVGDFRIPEDQDWMVLNILHPQPGHIAPYSWDLGWVYAVGTDADKFKEAICHKIGLTNYAPVAIDDAYSVNEDTTRNVAAPGVLANDTDVDGDTLAAILVSDVGHGTLTLNTDGSFSYTPNAGFTGSDSFNYKANDGTDDSNVATVTITVDPIGPGPGPGRVAYIVIEPDGAEITAGATQPYTASAFDALDNYIGDVTNDTLFSIIEGGHGGNWVDNVYTSQYAGTWTVNGNIAVPGTYDGINDTASLTVIAGSLDHIVISADTDTITAGDTLAFSAEAFDSFGNSWDVTTQTDFSIEAGAGGNWDPPNIYTSENSGTWTVTGTYYGKSDTYSLTVNTPGGGRGGGGGGGLREYLTVNWEGEITQERITRSGKLLATLEAPSPDEMHLLVIDKGTITLDSEGDVVKLIEITEATAPSLPASTALVGSAYDFGGNLSITFSKPVTLTLSYNVSDLRDDTLALSMRRYSSEDGLWEVVETESSQIADIGSFTGKPEGFSVFAIFADLPIFEVSNLSISPSQREIWDIPTFAVRKGEEAVVTADVTNTGNYEASYITSLQVNGEIMDSQELTLSTGQTEQVTFTISGIEQGDYQIVVGGLSDEFTSSLWINWLPIGAILGALFLIVFLLVGWRYRKREKPAEKPSE